MLFISARSNARRELIKTKLIELFETNPVGVTLDLGRVPCSREQVPGSLAYQLTDALGRRIISSLVAERLDHLGLKMENLAVRYLSADLFHLLEKLCPYSVWGSPAKNANRTFDRRKKLLTALITEMIEDRQLFIDPDVTVDGPISGNEPRDWHLIVTSRQLVTARQGETA